MTSLPKHRRAWEDLGRVDPFWAVLNDPARRHGHWDPAEFFATGEWEIAALMRSADELGLPRQRAAALDFGCGVGRMARPLASQFESYTGIDISEAMLAQAREWNRDCSRCRFILNTTGDLQPFESASVDLIYSRFVLQHLPSRALVESYLRDFIRILRPGGLLVFQLPRRIGLLHRLQPRRRVYALLRGLGVSERILLGPLNLTPMAMRAMPEPAVAQLVETLGAHVVKAEHPSDLDQVYFISR
ncbi:MAG: class I SAM-dependent methyltransferase [Gemmatimonadales bacterium]